MHGYARRDQLLRKDGARPGDAVVLSKPIGTGVLLAAARAGCAESAWVEAAHATMLRSNGPMMRLLQAHTAHACTDVTGFGLVGHAGDLARRSEVTVELERSAIPALPGALELLENDWRSSFHSVNDRAQETSDPHNPLLIDPQTSGGLLAAVPKDRVADLQRACAEAGEDLYVIGKVVEQSSDGPIRVV